MKRVEWNDGKPRRDMNLRDALVGRLKTIRSNPYTRKRPRYENIV